MAILDADGHPLDLPRFGPWLRGGGSYALN